MLVDPELAERARELLREPHEANGKGNMSALGTHEFTAEATLGLEPPLSPPVVRGPSAMMPDQSSDALPSPPPALRPPETSVDEPEQTSDIPEFPPAPQLNETPATPPQPDPLEEQTLMAPPPLAPVQPNEKAVEPKLPAMAPELPTMAPAPEPVQPAATPPEPVVHAPELTPPPAPAPEPAPAPAEVTELQPTTLTPPAPAPVETPAAQQPEPPAVELPVIDITPAAPPAPEALPEEPPAIDLTPPAPAAPAPVVEPAFVTPGRGVFKVVVRLKEGDGVEVGQFPDFGTAMGAAQEVIEQFSNANGSWPFYAGRFIRPDLIISVDVVEA
jgi:hypothetical protein